jgi:protein-disulfide isomerase
MKRLLPIILSASAVLLTACTDTTGISAESSRTVHPSTNPGAIVKVVEFADLQCPACRGAHASIVKPLIEKYGMKIRYDFMHFPLQTLHPYALKAAEAAECAADQKKFWEFIDHNYTNQEKLNKDVLKDWAQELGLDVDLFGRCLDSGIKRDGILDEYQKGKGVGVAGTPTFYVNGQKVESGLAEISAAIDTALANPGQKL